MASLLKRKRELAPRNLLAARRAERRFSTASANPVQSQLFDHAAAVDAATLRTVQIDIGRGTDAQVNPEQDQEIDDRLAEIIMAVDMKEKGTVGCCFYNAQEERLSILSDTQYGGKEFIDMCEPLHYEIKPKF